MVSILYAGFVWGSAGMSLSKWITDSTVAVLVRRVWKGLQAGASELDQSQAPPLKDSRGLVSY